MSRSGKNLEIDLMQENRNRDLIKITGANTTSKAVEQVSRAVGRDRKVIKNLMFKQVSMPDQLQFALIFLHTT